MSLVRLFFGAGFISAENANIYFEVKTELSFDVFRVAFL